MNLSKNIITQQSVEEEVKKHLLKEIIASLVISVLVTLLVALLVFGWAEFSGEMQVRPQNALLFYGISIVIYGWALVLEAVPLFELILNLCYFHLLKKGRLQIETDTISAFIPRRNSRANSFRLGRGYRDTFEFSIYGLYVPSHVQFTTASLGEEYYVAFFPIGKKKVQIAYPVSSHTLKGKGERG
ncbi:MAG: hypothetical protein IKC69_05620 [Clostridia bacterium]|nr:hypothetical protein [Clostridia bacterium]